MPTVILKPTAISASNKYPPAVDVTWLQPPDDDGTTAQRVMDGSIGGISLPRVTITDYEDFYYDPVFENPTNLTIQSVTLFIRTKRNGAYLGLDGRANLFGSFIASFNAGDNWTTQSFVLPTKPAGGAWTLADVNNLTAVINSNGNADFSVTTVYVSVEFSWTQTPNAPSSLAIDTLDASSIKLIWDDNSNVEEHFELQRSLDGLTWDSLVTLDPNTVTYTDTTVRELTHYYYRIRAYNSDHSSAWSNTVDDTSPAYAGPADDPTDFAAVNLTPNSFSLVWNAGEYSDTFTIDESFDGGTTWNTLAILAYPTTSYDISGKLPGSSYTYRIKSSNSVGDSAWVVSELITLPERSFREFLQKEVLQDVVQTFGWYDRVKLPDQEFTVTQTLTIRPDLTAREITEPISITPMGQGVGGIPTSVAFYRYTFKSTNIIRVSPPLISELPAGTVVFKQLFADGFTATYNGTNVDVWAIVGQNPAHVTQDGTVLVDGAAIGDTIIYLYKQRYEAGTTTPIGPVEEFVMAGGLNQRFIRSMFAAGDIVGSWPPRDANPFISNVSITTTVDYGREPFDASFIYNSMTNDALLRLGYASESEVPASDYQQFRDAGRVAAWRFVAYSAVKFVIKTTTEEITGLGSVDRSQSLNQIFETAMTQLQIAEDVYNQRYVDAPVVVSAPVTKPRANTYSSGVKVRF
jgi:hypothetical protein